MITGNKGEWSEIYVLVSLLTEGKLFQSDINLNKDPENVYDVIKGYKFETDYKLEFERSEEIRLFKIKDGRKEKVSSFSIEQFKQLSDNLYEGIKQGKKRTFKIEKIDNFLESLLIKKLKAPSTSKADINLRIYDHRLAKETELGFSIKSLLGGNSTLFNTGSGNNFIYQIQNTVGISLSEFNLSTYKPAGNLSKITFRLKELEKKGALISFKEIQSFQLWKNLKMVDGDLPVILGYALLYRWLYRQNSLKKVAELLEENDPLNFYNNQGSAQKLYEYKLKKFLTESAMGMTSETPWMGEYDKFGGVIIAKEDRDILCFHIYDFNLFRNYLINNTIFEQASTGEDGNNPGNPRNTGKKYHYGWLYQDKNELHFKINLQIRFK